MQGMALPDAMPVVIPARDGLSLEAFLTLPTATAGPRPAQRSPMIVYVHGGPWDREDYGFSRKTQWLANRGYAVLTVNYRGSTGLGKAYQSAGDGEWGRRMQYDLVDAASWAVRQGYASADRIGIMGGSYGGYATLSALAFTPGVFACGVDSVGPSNLLTFLERLPAKWGNARVEFYKRVADPRTATGRNRLVEMSPASRLDRVDKPLLIFHGVNDPRVNYRESKQVAEAIHARGGDVAYVEFPDEGHSFEKPANVVAYAALTENFLARCLGGRAQPISGDLSNSSAVVRLGKVK